MYTLAGGAQLLFELWSAILGCKNVKYIKIAWVGGCVSHLKVFQEHSVVATSLAGRLQLSSGFRMALLLLVLWFPCDEAVIQWVSKVTLLIWDRRYKNSEREQSKLNAVQTRMAQRWSTVHCEEEAGREVYHLRWMAAQELEGSEEEADEEEEERYEHPGDWNE